MKTKKNIYHRPFNSMRILMLLVLAALLMPELSAQRGKSNFSGTWALNESKSDFGNSQFRMGASEIIILQKGKELTDDRTYMGFDGNEIKLSDKYTLDGKECENEGMWESTKKSTLSWSDDKKSLIISSTVYFNMNGEDMEIEISETWKLADDGKALIIESVFPTPEGEMKTVLHYDKK